MFAFRITPDSIQLSKSDSIEIAPMKNAPRGVGRAGR
jgi:hypothetical protein